MSLPKSVVVLVIDRLGAAWLGPYGNTWLGTPNFNRLATQSVLFETAIAATPDLPEAYRGFWTGRHVLEPKPSAEATLPLPSAKDGLATFVTDDESLSKHDLAAGFSEIHFLRPTKIDKSAKSVEDTDLYSFFEVACELVAAKERPSFIWFHSRGMSGPWDAPVDMRFHFADEDDPEPPAFVAPPEKLLDAAFDPDEVLGFVQAYAAQVQIADICLGMLTDVLQNHPLAADTLFVVTSPRGYPLGEHRRIGLCDRALYGELLHLPLLIQFPGGERQMSRSQRIVQPHQVLELLRGGAGARLLEWMNEPQKGHSVAVAISDNQRAIRTPAWFLRESLQDEQPTFELFAKPDDRFEANEISSRCDDVVQLLAADLDRFSAAAAEGKLSEIPPLAEILYDTWR
jgi:hypothetical protein